MNPHLKLVKLAAGKVVPSSTWDYQSAMGAMFYLSLMAMPYVGVFVVSCIAAKQDIKYLYATKAHGITYARGGSAWRATHSYAGLAWG